jgi:hypothetical protein
MMAFGPPKVSQVTISTLYFSYSHLLTTYIAICVDGGMFVGGRTFLEINQGIFKTYYQNADNNEVWKTKDLTNEMCRS